jgi:FAD/FMN-containing dehydrogenase
MAKTLAPWNGARSYMNFHERPVTDSTSLWDEATYHRLRRIKQAVDPTDLFRSNHPIGAA